MFSEREQDIIDSIGRKKITVAEIADQVFRHSFNKPFDANISIGNGVRRIIAKCDHYNLEWTLKRELREGKHIIWKERL